MKRFLAALTAITFAGGLALVGVAAPAAATPSSGTTYTGTATCSSASFDRSKGDLDDDDYLKIVVSQGGHSVTIEGVVNVGSNDRVEFSVNGNNQSGDDEDLSNGAINSGKFSFDYTDFLATGKWTVTSVQAGHGSTDGPVSQPNLSCDTTPKDADASVTMSHATCDAPGAKTDSDLDHATLGTVTYNANDNQYGAGYGSYSVVATASSGHEFSDGSSTKTLTGKYELKKPSQSTNPNGACYVAPPAKKYVLVAWTMPSWIGAQTPSWPQTFYKSVKENTKDLNALDLQLALTCGSQYQVDLYNDSDITTSLINGGHLYDTHNPNEDLVDGDWGVAYKLVKGADCATPESGEAHFTVATCTPGSDNNANLDTVPGGRWYWTENGSSTQHAITASSHISPSGLDGYGHSYTFHLRDKDSDDGYVVTSYDSSAWTPFNATPAACAVPSNGTASFTVATCAPGTANTAHLDSVAGGTWTWTKDGGPSHTIAAGTIHVGDLGGFGTYVFHLADGSSSDGYVVTPYTSASWTPFDASAEACAVPSNGTASFTVATCAPQTANTAQLDNVSGGVWSWSKNGGPSTTISAGTVHVSALDGFGTYVFSLADGNAHDGFIVTPYTSASWTPFDASPEACAVPEEGSASFVVATCVPDSVNTVTLDTVPGGQWSWTKDAGTSHNVSAGTHNASDLDGFGVYVFTLTDADAHDGFAVVSYTSDNWTPFDASPEACAVPSNGTASFVVATCAPDSLNTVTLDTVPGGQWSWTKDAGTSNTIAAGAHNVSDLDGFGVYVFTLTDADAHDGYTVTTYTSASWTPFDAPTLCAVPADPSADPQTCAAGVLTGGSITFTLDPRLVYSITGGPSNINITNVQVTNLSVEPGTYLVSVAAAPGFVLVDGPHSWPLTVDVTGPDNCRNITTDASLNVATCTPDLDNSVEVPAQIVVALDNDVIYKLDGVAVTSATTEVAAGVHNVTAELTPSAAAAGYALTQTSWPAFNVESVDCDLTTLPAWSAGASGHPAVCTPSGDTQDGYISLVHLADEKGKVDYSIQKDGSSTVKALGNTSTKVHVAPGHYTVTAAPHVAGDGISTDTVFHINIGAVDAICTDLKTLALTGGTASLGLALAGGMLFLGIAGIYMRRRYGRAAQ